jgi:hypothetical protein
MPSKPRPLLEPDVFEDLVKRRNVADLIEALSQFVKEAPGRKRVYESDAEKMRLYRLRKKEVIAPKAKSPKSRQNARSKK